MLVDLGKALNRAREGKGLSLEAAAGPANISGAYLHKLERGVVGSPSPRVLARIATVLEVPYLRLMELAGYLDEERLAEARTKAPLPHPLADQDLTPEEWKQVGALIEKLVAQRSASSSAARSSS